MNRRELLATGMLLAVAGCTESADEPTDDPSNETDQSEPDDSEEPEDTNESTESDTAIEIASIDAPDTVGQTELFDVSVTVSSNEPGDVAVTLVDANDETVDEASTEITGEGEETVTVSLSVGDSVPAEESTIRVIADNGSESAESSTSITITSLEADWEAPFEEAKASINAFLDDLTSAGSEADDRTILDTTISDSYDGLEGSGYISDAEGESRDAYNEAKPDSDTRARMDRLRDEVSLLEGLRVCQRETCAVFEKLEAELEGFRNGDSLSGEVDEQYNIALDEVDNLSTLVEETEPVIGDDYGTKIDQIEGELEIVDRMINALTAIFSARNNFEAELYGTAFDRAQSARRGFERAVDDIDDEATYPPEDSVDETFRDHAAEWENEASEIENGASGRQTETDN